MKRYILLLFLFVSLSFSQKVDSYERDVFYESLKNKNPDYFSLNISYKLSLDELKNFYDKCVANNYKIGEVFLLNRIGAYYKQKNDCTLSLTYYNKALKICEDNNFIDPQLVCLNLIAVVYRKQDDIKNALSFYQSVISLSKKIKKKNNNNLLSISIAENSLGSIYLSLRQYKLAIKQFEKALKLQENVQNLRGSAINYQNIGKAYENLNLFNLALKNYQESLIYNRQMNSSLGNVICYNGIASVYIKQGNYNNALTLLEKIYPKALKLKKIYEAETLSNLGWVYLKLKKYSIAQKKLQEALKITKDLTSRKTLHISVLNHLAELYEEKGDIKKSYLYFKQSSEEDKKILGFRNDIYLSNLISKHDLESQKNDFNELKNEAEIKSLQLIRNRNILIITLITIALLGAVLFSIDRHHILKNDKKILLLEQQALQAQMNPHFVFNALNSIKLYIINNEQKNAVYYLNKFSKLIRNILEVSKVKEVSLKEELNTMNLYMTIENIRFDNSIEYIEKIDPNLNTGTIKVPPLVLQPFLENSIWHGLSSKEGKKEIIIEAKEKDKNIVEITITDNGIGREAAEKIKKNKSLKRNSVGIELTKQRLITFCNDFTNDFSLEYLNLVDADKKTIGTTVTLKIPLS